MLLAELCMTQPARLRDSTVRQPAGGRRPYWNCCPAHWSHDTQGHFLLLLSSSFIRTFLHVLLCSSSILVSLSRRTQESVLLLVVVVGEGG